MEAGAGAGALAEEFVSETARWHWPENMLRYEGGAAPENVRILRVRGNSMEPEMREGDRIVVDVSRRLPSTGETFVLWDGNGLVVKQVERVQGHEEGGAEPPRLRLISANPDYAPYACLAPGRPRPRQGALGGAAGVSAWVRESREAWTGTVEPLGRLPGSHTDRTRHRLDPHTGDWSMMEAHWRSDPRSPIFLPEWRKDNGDKHCVPDPVGERGGLR